MKTKTRSVLIAVLFLCLAAVPNIQAVNPPPDGGYPNFTTAEGTNALKNLTTGAANTAVGWFSLFGDTTASFNTGVGAGTLLSNTGDANTAVGAAAGLNLTTGSSNICIGSGVVGGAGENNTIRIGDNLPNQGSSCYIGGIYGEFPGLGESAVYVGSNNKLGIIPSSRRFKHDIQPMNKVSEAILALKPVTFHYKSDAKNTPHFGLIAEEVAAANPALVVADKEGKPYTVRYEAVNAMLLNEFLKEHKKVELQQTKIENQDATIAQLKQHMQVLTAQLQEQAAQIQEVSAQLKATRPAPQMALNP
jgi:hypothetical protein